MKCNTVNDVIPRSVNFKSRILHSDQASSEPSFGEGLSRVLLGLNAATTRNVISSTMAHLISCNNESRFVISHKFSDLLGRQMEATLEGQDINVRIRTNKVPGDELKCWPDSLADDYIHRSLYKKNLKTFVFMI